MTVIGAPTVREADGLAMSSRNVYLDPEERAAAPLLYAVLSGMAHDLSLGRAVEDTVRQGWVRLENGGFRMDYLEVRDAETLMPIENSVESRARLLAAVHLGQVRLIDNVVIVPVSGR
jgi:pantoate--beta-alanine ligase